MTISRRTPRVCLSVEVLEDRTTPAAMPVGSVGALSGLGGSVSTGAVQSSAPGSPMVQALLRQASQSLNTLSSTFTAVAVQVNAFAAGSPGNPQQQIGNLLPQLQGSLLATTATLNSVARSLAGLPAGRLTPQSRAASSVLRAFAASLGTVSVAVDDLAGSLPSTVATPVGTLPTPTGTLPNPLFALPNLPAGFPNTTAAFLGSLLTSVARNSRALSRGLNTLAGNTPVTATQEVNAVLVGVNASLNNVALSLNAFSGTLAGAVATATGNGSPLLVGTSGPTSPLLTGGLQVLGSTLGAVQNSLNALADILPTAAHLPLGTARPLLRGALTSVAADLGVVSGQLNAVAGPFSGSLATSLGSVFLTVSGPGGSLGSTSLTLGTLFGDVVVSLGRLAVSLGTLGRSLPGLTPAALVRATGAESGLLRTAAADVGLLVRQLTTAQSLLGLTPGFPMNPAPANGAQVIDALFATASQNLDLVSADLLRLMNGV